MALDSGPSRPSWAKALDERMASAHRNNGLDEAAGLPQLTRGDAMRIVHWVRLAKTSDVDVYPLQLLLLGYEKEGDKFRVDKEWVNALVPGAQLAAFWDGPTLVDVRLTEAQAPAFSGKGKLESIWQANAAHAWLRLQRERAKKKPPPIPIPRIRNPLKGAGAVLVALAVLYVLSRR